MEIVATDSGWQEKIMGILFWGLSAFQRTIPRILVFMDHNEYGSFRKKKSNVRKFTYSSHNWNVLALFWLTEISLFYFYQKILVNLWNTTILELLVHLYIMFALTIPWKLKIWETDCFFLLIQIWEKVLWGGGYFCYQSCLLELTYMMLTNSFCFSSYILWMLLLPKSGYIKIIDMVPTFKELTILKKQLYRHVNKYGT